MTNPSLTHVSTEPQTYTLKELQLVVRDVPAIPAEIEPFVGVQFRSSLDIFKTFRQLATMPSEVFLVVHLDCKNRLVGMTTTSIGSLTTGLAHPREVFRSAIINLTNSIIWVHNHPSGDPEPSTEDLEITRQLSETGRVIGIHVLDHIIIGSHRYFSFADEGLI